MSSESFADLGVSRPVLGALAERGIKEPFAVQRLCIADVLAGEDVLVQSPTGSGKTFAFGIPMVERTQAAKSSTAATDRSGTIGLTPPSTGPLSVFSPSDASMYCDSRFRLRRQGPGDAVQRPFRRDQRHHCRGLCQRHHAGQGREARHPQPGR